jgi:hypothetical protein
MKRFIVVVFCLMTGFSVFSQNTQAVYKQTAPSLITLKSVDILGYGFFISQDLVVTNYQVINKARMGAAKAVFTDGRSVDVLGFVAASEEANIVILKVDCTDGKALKLDTSAVKPNDILFLFSQKNEQTDIYEGSMTELKDYGFIKMLQIKSTVLLSNSGFPVLNAFGEVTGISIPSPVNDTTMNFAITARKVEEIYNGRKAYVEELKSLSPPTSIDNKTEPKSDQFDIYINQGNTRMIAKDYRGAIDKFTSAIKLYPGDPDAYVFRGQARIYLMQYKDAMVDFNKAIDLEPNFAEAYDLRGIVKAELGDKPGACEDWTKSFELGFNEAFKLIKEFCDIEEDK